MREPKEYKYKKFTGTVVKKIYYDVYIEVPYINDEDEISNEDIMEQLIEEAKISNPVYGEEYIVIEEDIKLIH
jgi:hypothetical protein